MQVSSAGVGTSVQARVPRAFISKLRRFGSEGEVEFVEEAVVPGYNVMGVAKAALESTARYLAYELGEKKIRVNTLSAGPVRTLSAMAVGGIDEMFAHVERKSPLKRNIDGDEVGRAALFLLSDLSSGVTGENLYVDSGFNIVGL